MRLMKSANRNSRDDEMSEIDVFVQEVGLRDGLQNVEQVMPTEAKMAWIGALAVAGVRQIQGGSFVPPKLMPQLADTADVVKRTQAYHPQVAMSVLVPNLKGGGAGSAGQTGSTRFCDVGFGHPQRPQRAPHG